MNINENIKEQISNILNEIDGIDYIKTPNTDLNIKKILEEVKLTLKDESEKKTNK